MVSRISTKCRELKRRGLLLSTLSAGACLTSGCAYEYIAAYPKDQRPVTLSVEKQFAGFIAALPPGLYYDEKRRIFVTGYQYNTAGVTYAGAGMIFARRQLWPAALLGPAIRAINVLKGEARYGEEVAKLNTDLIATTRQTVTDRITAFPTKKVRRLVSRQGELQVRPSAVFTVNEDGNAQLHVLLEAEIPIKDQPSLWTARYFVPVPGEYPVESPTGWTMGTRYRDGVEAALKTGVDLLFDDIDSKLTGHHTVRARGRFAFINRDTELPFLLVREEKDYVVARLVGDDGRSTSGTHVLRRSDIKFTEATFKIP